MIAISLRVRHRFRTTPGVTEDMQCRNWEGRLRPWEAKVYAGCVNPLPVEDLEHIYSHTRLLWESVRGRRFFITGGTGFFGTWLLESFAYCNRKLSLNAEATVLTRDPGAFVAKVPQISKEPSIRLHQGDVRSFTFPGQHFDYIIHAAAPTSAEAASHPMDLMRTIIHGTEC